MRAGLLGLFVLAAIAVGCAAPALEGAAEATLDAERAQRAAGPALRISRTELARRAETLDGIGEEVIIEAEIVRDFAEPSVIDLRPPADRIADGRMNPLNCVVMRTWGDGGGGWPPGRFRIVGSLQRVEDVDTRWMNPARFSTCPRNPAVLFDPDSVRTIVGPSTEDVGTDHTVRDWVRIKNVGAQDHTLPTVWISSAPVHIAGGGGFMTHVATFTPADYQALVALVQTFECRRDGPFYVYEVVVSIGGMQRSCELPAVRTCDYLEAIGAADSSALLAARAGGLAGLQSEFECKPKAPPKPA